MNRPLRLWPGLAAVVILVLARFVMPAVSPGADLTGLAISAIASLVIILWWVFFSRARWVDRLGVVVLAAAAILAMRPLLDPSIAGAGMGNLYYIYAVQLLTIVIPIAAFAARRTGDGARRAAMAAAIVLACGLWALIRTGGVSNSLLGSDFHWRWTPTPEQRLLAQSANELPPAAPAPAEAAAPAPAPTQAPALSTQHPAPSTASAAPSTEHEAPSTAPAALSTDSEWPGFRGPARDGVVHGVRIATDWAATPPVPLWRRAVGPGWSSFAVRGDRLYTQEQRGEDEVVACYRVSTGEPLWAHRDANRFYESNGGPGPRGTPAIAGTRVFAFGAMGVLNALDAETGARAWSRNVAADVKRALPGWGFTSSPLVIGDVVIVAASGSLAAYDVTTGEPRWAGPRWLGSYSSPHRATIDGVEQVLLLNGSGAAGVAPGDGTVLWESKWESGTPIVQPAVTDEGDVLINSISMTGGNGIRRISLEKGGSGWAVAERWTSTGLKPYFNDFVLHKGHAFGFDGNILSSINLEDGTRNWKGGRYGNGQMVLLADQDVLLVISEDGELALVSATPDKFTELARVPALDGKTWNHPVIVGDVLLVRNGQEMAAFRLPLAGR